MSQAAALPSRASRTRRALWAVMLVLSMVVVLVAAMYWRFDPQTYFPQQRAVFLSRQVPLYLHIGGAMVALALAPWQLRSGPRQRRSGSRRVHWHRVLGRVYLLGCLVGGIGGLALSSTAYGGPVARAGFAGLGIAWLTTGAAGLVAVRQGRIADHRRWMVASVALTLAAVTLRLYLAAYAGLDAAGLIGVTFAQAYAAIAWLAWLPNLTLAWWLTRPSPGRRGLAAADSVNT